METLSSLLSSKNFSSAALIETAISETKRNQELGICQSVLSILFGALVEVMGQQKLDEVLTPFESPLKLICQLECFHSIMKELDPDKGIKAVTDKISNEDMLWFLTTLQRCQP